MCLLSHIEFIGTGHLTTLLRDLSKYYLILSSLVFSFKKSFWFFCTKTHSPGPMKVINFASVYQSTCLGTFLLMNSKQADDKHERQDEHCLLNEGTNYSSNTVEGVLLH
jgi:hypothetical protein